MILISHRGNISGIERDNEHEKFEEFNDSYRGTNLFL